MYGVDLQPEKHIKVAEPFFWYSELIKGHLF